ncbi:MAG: hypothetical protein R2710_17670 [Acidimicrobiales bacterium]
MGIPLTVARVPGVDPPVDGYRILPEDYSSRIRASTPPNSPRTPGHDCRACRRQR